MVATGTKKRKINTKLVAVIGVLGAILLGVSTIPLMKGPKIKIDIKENVEINVNSEYYNLDGIKEIKNGEIATEKELVDTSKVGKKTITIEVKNKLGKKEEYTYEVNIVDKEAPTINYNENIKVESGKEIDLLKDVKATDNSGEIIGIKVEGEYDFNKAGTYELYYVAKDSSGNETKNKFVLEVTEKSVPNNSSSNGNSNSSNNGSSSSNSNNGSSSSNNGDTTYFTTSKGFKGYTKNGITYIDGFLVANKTYSLPSSYTGGTSTKGLTKEVYNAFLDMQQGATAANVNIYVQSGYRSYDTQKRLYNNYVARDGKAAADTYSARPGNSEHQTGLAFDVCSNGYPNACINDGYHNTEPARWLSANAYKYGFILRYPKGKENETGYKYESWHFRYVGIDLASKLYNNGDWITLEDYFGITSEYK